MNKIIILIFISSVLMTQEMVKNLILVDSISKEPLIHIEVRKNNHFYGLSNYHGIIVLQGELSDTISFHDLNIITREILFKYLDDKIELKEKIYTDSLSEVISDAHIEIAQMSNGLNIIRQRDLKAFPQFFGESDALKTIQNKNGVSIGKDFSNKLFVRGGQSDQNLFMIDGSRIYQTSHLFGFFSVFHSNAISQIELFKSNQPIEFSNALSSIVNVHYKSGNMNEIHYGGGLGMMNSHIYIEGPLNSNTRVFLALRKSYVDILLKTLSSSDNQENEINQDNMNIFDSSLKITQQFNDFSKLDFTMFYSLDNIMASNNENGRYLQLDWKNNLYKLNYNLAFSNHMIANFQCSISLFEKKYQNQMFGKLTKSNQTLSDFVIKSELSYFKSTHHWNLGFEFSSIKNKFYDIEFNSYENLQTRKWGRIYASYLEKRIFNNLDLNVGNSFTLYQAELYLEPRINFLYHLSEKDKLKWHYNFLRQYQFALNSSLLGDDFSSIYFSESQFKPQISHSTAVAYETVIGDILIQSEAYYKTFENLYFLQSNPFNKKADQLDKGHGYAYGLDINIERKWNQMSAWFSIAFQNASWQFHSINMSRSFAPKFLKPIQCQLFINKTVTKSWSFALSGYFGSGYLITTPKSYIPFAQSRIYQYDHLNNFRLPFNRRIDFTINHHFSWFSEKSTVKLGLYNILGSQNPLAVYFYGSNSEIQYLSIGFFPSLSYSFDM